MCYVTWICIYLDYNLCISMLSLCHCRCAAHSCTTSGSPERGGSESGWPPHPKWWSFQSESWPQIKLSRMVSSTNLPGLWHTVTKTSTNTNSQVLKKPGSMNVMDNHEPNITSIGYIEPSLWDLCIWGFFFSQEGSYHGLFSESQRSAWWCHRRKRAQQRVTKSLSRGCRGVAVGWHG